MGMVTSFQCKCFFALHDGQAAGDALVAYVDNVDAHIGDDGEQAHKFARSVDEAGMKDEVAACGGKAMFDETPDQIDVNVSPG